MLGHLHLEGNMIHLVLHGLFGGDMWELSEVSVEFRFSPDDTITDSLGILPLKLESVFLHFHDLVRFDGNRRLSQSLVALTRPRSLILFTPIENRVEALKSFIFNEIRSLNALLQEPGRHSTGDELFSEGINIILILLTEQVVLSGHVHVETVSFEIIHLDLNMGHLLDSLATLTIIAVISNRHNWGQLNTTVDASVAIRLIHKVEHTGVDDVRQFG